jgi:hypothetical protein
MLARSAVAKVSANLALLRASQLAAEVRDQASALLVVDLHARGVANERVEDFPGRKERLPDIAVAEAEPFRKLVLIPTEIVDRDQHDGLPLGQGAQSCDEDSAIEGHPRMVRRPFRRKVVDDRSEQ